MNNLSCVFATFLLNPVLMIEPKTLCMLGKHSITEKMYIVLKHQYENLNKTY